MIYEHRKYVSLPGKQAALFARFESAVLQLFEKHGMDVVGFWQPITGQTMNELHYILRWKDLAQMERSWKLFFADSTWERAVAESEADGPILVGSEVELWRTAPFYRDTH